MKVKKQRNSNRGITLIAMMVTIVILIILAGITVYALVSENGILKNAKRATKDYEEARREEEEKLDKLYSSILIGTNDSSQITIKVEDLKTLINKTVEEKLEEASVGPVGTVISYMGNSVPNGYLGCDGTSYKIEEYPKLAEQIKKEFGSYNYYGGDGEETFAVPDLRGEFLRGTGTATRNTGAGGVVGKHQDATVHTRIYNVKATSTDTRLFMGASAMAGNFDTYREFAQRYNLRGQEVTVTNEGGTGTYTSRPTNTAVLYCIKY